MHNLHSPRSAYADGEGAIAVRPEMGQRAELGAAPSNPVTLDDLIGHTARRLPEQIALIDSDRSLTYRQLDQAVSEMARRYRALGLERGERIAIYLEKRVETVAAAFAAARAGLVFVPVNPLLKGDQVAYILADCGVRLLVTSAARLDALSSAVQRLSDLKHVFVVDEIEPAQIAGSGGTIMVETLSRARQGTHDRQMTIDRDLAAILYTSGSTGRPKGVMLSHRNMISGAQSVASYLGNGPHDRILAVLPLSFDAGFSQLTTAFFSGATAVLLNHLFAKDVIDALVAHRITGLTAVPPLWIQLADLAWPESIQQHLRYIANTGGRMPKSTLTKLRAHVPGVAPYLMYGLTEAFRSTYLPPSEVDRRPESIGRAIPNAEILVLRDDGSPCGANEPGELVHRGALVGLGYWNDPEKTAERYRALPVQSGVVPAGAVMPEIAVYSGDTVTRDEEGFLYFVGRRDEMIKTSGYRVSPTELEEVIYGLQEVAEVAALGLAHPSLGQAIALVVYVGERSGNLAAIRQHCQRALPAYMQPARILESETPLPRNPNGKIDRKSLAQQHEDLFGGAQP